MCRCMGAEMSCVVPRSFMIFMLSCSGVQRETLEVEEDLVAIEQA